MYTFLSFFIIFRFFTFHMLRIFSFSHIEFISYTHYEKADKERRTLTTSIFIQSDLESEKKNTSHYVDYEEKEEKNHMKFMSERGD